MRPRRFARFAFVGLIGVGLQLCLLNIFIHRFLLAPLLATALAVELTVVHNWCWHERFTWAEQSRCSFARRIKRLWRFHLSNGLVSLAGNAALAYWLVERLHAPVLPSGVASMALCSLTNYVLADKWVYQRRSSCVKKGHE